jgi:hypothetical protein
MTHTTPSGSTGSVARIFSGGAIAARTAVAAFVALGLFAAIGSPVGVQAASARPDYSCTPYHCFGLNDWPGVVNGSHTAVSVVHLSCTPGANQCGQGWFVDNEMWLNDNGSSYRYWVEAGYSTNSNDHITYVDYFWADTRPGYGHYEHILSSVPPGDYGNYVNLTIKLTSSSSFQALISSPNYSYSATSINNSMSPNDITIGQELFGSSGASAPTAHFINNQYINTSNVSIYQYLNGSLSTPNPPYGGWTTQPRYSSTGGNMYTDCC